jgi:uncharacterized membrane protein
MLHLLLLLIWIVWGAIIRFSNLTLKAPWSDEWATLVFSNAQSFKSVPLDRAINLDTLLFPVQYNSQIDLGGVVNNLMTESNHPPVYFLLTHLWLKLFPGETISLWGARALPAFLGVVSIPAIFYLTYVAFRSVKIAQIAAALMAFSPYGIYISQEARHYTLPVLLIIASLCCLVVAARSIIAQQNLPVLVAASWIIVNILGIAVHYFFALAICAQGLVVLTLWVRDWKGEKSLGKFLRYSQYWYRIYLVAWATFLGGLVWLPAWSRIPDNNLTDWVTRSNSFANFLEPIVRLFAWITTMFLMLPVEGQSLWVIILAIAVVIGFLVWAIPICWRGIRIELKSENNGFGVKLFGGVFLGAIALILFLTYAAGMDLTLVARYQFIYFPTAIILLAASLGYKWKKRFFNSTFVIFLIAAIFGSLTVVTNLGYQKGDRPDLVVPIIAKTDSFQNQNVPILIATVQKNHEQTGEMMGLAWEFKKLQNSSNSPWFLLAHKDGNSEVATATLHETISQFPRPFDLWAVNFAAPVEAEKVNCFVDDNSRNKVPGYSYKRYRCW